MYKFFKRLFCFLLYFHSILQRDTACAEGYVGLSRCALPTENLTVPSLAFNGKVRLQQRFTIRTTTLAFVARTLPFHKYY